MMYIRYPLSLRQVEDILFERGIDICHNTMRYWWNRFRPNVAGEIRKRRIAGRNWSNWRWHLDEVFVRTNGERHYLWCAVDHEGEVLEIFITKPGSPSSADVSQAYDETVWAAEINRYRPASIVWGAMKVLGNAGRQECGRWLNNRAENSHLRFRRREGAVARFRDIKTQHKFTAVHAAVYNHFNHQRNLNRPDIFKHNRTAALA